jgi:hypothetical protein
MSEDLFASVLKAIDGDHAAAAPNLTLTAPFCSSLSA